MIAAVLFTILPEVLRISPEARLVIYGVLLLIFALYFPGGIEGILQRFESKLTQPKSTTSNPALMEDD